jgi:hypothetical protein
MSYTWLSSNFVVSKLWWILLLFSALFIIGSDEEEKPASEKFELEKPLFSFGAYEFYTR